MEPTTLHALKVSRKATQASATRQKLQSTYAPGGYEHALFRSAPTRCRGFNTAAAADIIESTKEAFRSAPGRGKTVNPSVAHHHMTDSKHMPLPTACTTIGGWSSVDSREADYVCPRKPPFKSTRPSHRKPESVLDGEDVPALLKRQSGKNHLASASQSKCLTSTSLTLRTAHDMPLMECTTLHAPKVSRRVMCDSLPGPQANATKQKLQSTYVPGGYEYALFLSAPTRRSLNTAAEADIVASTKEKFRSAPGRGNTACPSVARHQTTDSKHIPLPAACATIGSWSSVNRRHDDADYVCPRKPPFKSTRPSHRKPESALDGEDVAPALLKRQSGKNHLSSANQSRKAAACNVLCNWYNFIKHQVHCDDVVGQT